MDTRITHNSDSQPMSNDSPKQVFVAWMSFQRRQLSMAPFFGFEPFFFPVVQTIKLLRPFQYLAHTIKTLSLLKKKRPRVIWVQLPQVPLLTAALWYKRITDPQVRIIADCHNRILNPPWNKWPGLKAQLNACDLVLVHNHTVVPKIQAMGILRNNLHILEDPPAVISAVGNYTLSFPKPWVLFLASFSPDEPIMELFEAARKGPEINFVLAGDSNRASGRHELSDYPPNVILPGYLSGEDLDAAITETNAVLALTKLDDAQLSSAAEAIGAGRPMVLSDTPVTRELYYIGGVFVDTFDPVSILRGCRRAIAEEARLSAESFELRDIRYSRWKSQAELIRELLTA
jgi:glycosyltransferase involved in cell wall biosynthesis